MTAARFYSSTAGAMVLQADITATASSMTVDSTVGLPGTTPYALVIDPGNAEEVVDVTSVSGTTLVITRAVDGTPAQSHPAGVKVHHMATARDFREPQEHIGSTVAHGTVGDVVGTGNTQALINKDLSSGTNTFPASLATDAELAAEAALRVAHAALTVAHGATGAVVGTTNAQTLTNKTLTGPVIGTPTFSDDVKIGDLASNTTRQFGVRRKAFTGANAYEGITYIQSGDANGNFSLVLQENGVEVGRVALRFDGHLQVVTGDIQASNIPTSGVAGTSTTKAKKRLHWGAATGVTQSGGFATITHGAGFTPTSIIITPSIAWQAAVTAITSTTFTVALRDDAGVAPTSPVTIYYLCGE